MSKMTMMDYSITEHFEGLRLDAYQDSGKIWTIGWGHTKDVYPGMVITIEQARQFIVEDMLETVSLVNSLNYNLNQNQFDALCDLVFNCGLHRLQISYPKLLEQLTEDPNDIQAVTDLWLNTAIHDALGHVLTDLLTRRRLEIALYSKPINNINNINT